MEGIIMLAALAVVFYGLYRLLKFILDKIEK